MIDQLGGCGFDDLVPGVVDGGQFRGYEPTGRVVIKTGNSYLLRDPNSSFFKYQQAENSDGTLAANTASGRSFLSTLRPYWLHVYPLFLSA